MTASNAEAAAARMCLSHGSCGGYYCFDAVTARRPATARAQAARWGAASAASTAGGVARRVAFGLALILCQIGWGLVACWAYEDVLLHFGIIGTAAAGCQGGLSSNLRLDDGYWHCWLLRRGGAHLWPTPTFASLTGPRTHAPAALHPSPCGWANACGWGD